MDYRSGDELGGRVLAEVARAGMYERGYVCELASVARGVPEIQAEPIRKQASTRFPTQASHFPRSSDL